jgi:type IV pilus assembly protein PilB
LRKEKEKGSRMLGKKRPPRRRLGEILLDAGCLEQDNLELALAEIGSSRGHPIGRHMVARGFITEMELAQALAVQNDLPFISLETQELSDSVVRLVSEKMARSYKFLPLEIDGDIINVALADPSLTFVLDSIRLKTGKEVKAFIAVEKDIETALDKIYADGDQSLANILDEAGDGDVEFISGDDEQAAMEELEEDVNQAPVIKLVDHYISQALRSRASDIHIEPREKDVRIRYRIDGVLHSITPPPKRFQNAVISRIKIMSDLDISERRRPQDGRFKIRENKRVVDFRVSTLPTVYGEKIVIRVLDKSNLKLDLVALGFQVEELDIFDRAISRPYGMVLVTGPTGSGKTTTLYSALQSVATEEKNLVTVEDPVEYRLDEINQVQTQADIGFTFAAGLRSILRQDPDVIMIGEIRDQETAEIAVKSALTGHLVFSTLHTNDAAGTLTRLVDMGIPPYLVTAATVLVVAQRLARRVCQQCRVAYRPEKDLLQSMDLPTDQDYTFYRSEGCGQCSGTGYRGRVALYELMEITPKMKTAINSGHTAQQLKELARRQGMKTLRDSGTAKVIDGITTLNEIMRVTFEDDEIDEDI